MSSTSFVILAFKIFSLIILINQVSPADYSGLLSLLYKQASTVDRPLIVVIDSNLLQSDLQAHKKSHSALDTIGYNRPENKLYNLLHRKKKLQNKLAYKPQKSYDIEKKLHHALLPMDKKSINREKQMLRSPIIRNLLRISNNLSCQAKDECQDQCNNRYSGPKNNKCVNTCQTKFQCQEEEDDDGCDECDANSCGEDNCTGSTKGYAVTEPSVGCPEC